MSFVENSNNPVRLSRRQAVVGAVGVATGALLAGAAPAGAAPGHRVAHTTATSGRAGDVTLYEWLGRLTADAFFT